jgi:hypothetical protein
MECAARSSVEAAPSVTWAEMDNAIPSVTSSRQAWRWLESKIVIDYYAKGHWSAYIMNLKWF